MANNKREGLFGSLLLVTGAVIGAASVLLYKESRPKRPGVVLEEAKQHFSKEGSIEGSWIHYDTVEYPHIDSKPLVYIGGISRIEDSTLVQYQFICDAYSGEILDIYVINS